MQAKFVSALIYPAVVVCVGIGIIIFFMTYMMPKFLSIFEGMKVSLPASTLMLMNSGKFFQKYWWAVALVVIALVVLFKRFQATTMGRRRIDTWKLNAPVFGKVKAGDTVQVRTHDGRSKRFVVQQVEAETLVAADGTRFTRTEIAGLQRRSFSAGKTGALAAGLAGGAFLLLLAAFAASDFGEWQ